MKVIKVLLFLLAALFLCAMAGVSAAGQAGTAGTAAPAAEWSDAFDQGEGHFVEQTRDGGLILTGWIDAGGAGADVFLAKYAGGGRKIWLQTYQGYGYSDSHCVREVSGGGFIAAGETKSKDAYDHDVYVVRTDNQGALLWEKVYGGPRCDYAWSVLETDDGGFILAGGTESSGAGIYDAYLIKLDAAGSAIWEKTYGGAGSDCGYDVLQLDDGGYLMAGNAESFGTGNPDVYLLKTDSNGNMIWQKTYGGSGSEYGWSLLETAGGGYIIAGEQEFVLEQGGGFAAYLLEVDAEGNLLWEKTYGNGRASSFYGACRVGEGYVLTGKIESDGGYDLYVVKAADDGSLLWEKTVDGAGAGSLYAAAQARGGFVAVGKRGIEQSSASEILISKFKTGSALMSSAFLYPAAAVVVLAGLLFIFRKPLARRGEGFKKIFSILA